MPAETHRPSPALLVVQDEPLIQMIMIDLAEEAGCEVIVAGTASEAIRLLESRADVRVVFADLDIERSSVGLELARAIRDGWPLVELILTSSTPWPPTARVLPERAAFVAKPFNAAGVMATIRGFA